MPQHSVRKLRRGLGALAVAMPALYLLFAGVVILEDRRATLERAQSDMRNIAAALSEHALRTFGEADVRLRTAIAEIERRQLTLAVPDLRQVHEVLAEATQGVPQSASLNVLDANGTMVASAAAYPLAPIDSRDREYFVRLAAQPTPASLIARPIRSRTSASWTIPLARRVDHPDGSVKMIVNLGVDMAYFDRFYRSLQLGERSRLMLVRRDGAVIMQTPLTADVLTRDLSGARLFAQLASAPSGVYQSEQGALGDGPRVVGYASMAQAPIVAVASIGRDGVLAPWRARCWQIAGIGLVSTLLLLLLLRFLSARLGELERAHLSLSQRNADIDQARRRYSELVDGIDGVVWEARLPDFSFTYVSGNAGAVSGHDAVEWVERPHFWRDVLCTTPAGERIDTVFALDGPGLIKPVEHCIARADGSEIWLRSNVMLAGSGSGALQVRGVTVDITGQKLAEQQLHQAIHADPLTGLPSRRALLERADHALALARRKATSVAIILVDVDDFKTINDSLGHDHGDAILVELARRLQDCLGATDTLARIGGDEFVVMLEDVGHDALRIEQLATRIGAAARQKMAVNGRELYLSLSMGIALFPQDAADCAALLRHADTALYRAKASGRDSWQFFDNAMARQVQYRFDLETALREAIDHGGFRLVYQPQCVLADGRVAGAEALLRWERPGLGMVSPQEVVRVAEENGSIVALGAWVLRTACLQAAAWRRAGLQLRMAVNVSAIQLRQADFVEQVRGALLHASLPADCLELEVTEGAFIADLDDTVDKLHQIRAMGVELALDDFGTGYSSLSYLKLMPFHRLKIDQSFVRDIPARKDDCAIVRAILAMARTLSLDVIAEGVESQAQADFLRAEGCQEMQGYFLAPAMAADAFAERFMLPAASAARLVQAP